MDHIYQASDLAAKRRELIDAARSGFAQIRDTDGTGLVLLPQGRFDLLRGLREQFTRFISLEAAFERPKTERRATDFGDFAWLAEFDEDDQLAFRRELMATLMQSLATDSVEPVERCIRDWRTTARALSNEKSRRVLTSPGESEASFAEVGRPERD
ncbi:MAG: hypothetical protein ACYC8T_16565 [Myxococcaceae bacterium]